MAKFEPTQMTNKWINPLTAEQLEAQHALAARLDPAFAKADREFWESRTEPQLRVLKAQAWDANDADGYQRANTYLQKFAAHMGGAVEG